MLLHTINVLNTGFPLSSNWNVNCTVFSIFHQKINYAKWMNLNDWIKTTIRQMRFAKLRYTQTDYSVTRYSRLSPTQFQSNALDFKHTVYNTLNGIRNQTAWCVSVPNVQKNLLVNKIISESEHFWVSILQEWLSIFVEASGFIACFVVCFFGINDTELLHSFIHKYLQKKMCLTDSILEVLYCDGFTNLPIPLLHYWTEMTMYQVLNEFNRDFELISIQSLQFWQLLFSIKTLKIWKKTIIWISSIIMNSLHSNCCSIIII